MYLPSKLKIFGPQLQKIAFVEFLFHSQHHRSKIVSIAKTLLNVIYCPDNNSLEIILIFGVAQKTPMLEHLIQIDRHLFYFINNDLGNSFFDWLMPLLRNARFWIPLYVFIIAFCLW